jgi:integrase
MAERLTDKTIAALPAPATGNRVYYDAPNASGKGWTPGFGLRVTAAGAKSFVLNYRTKAGRERRFTIGTLPTWKLDGARKEAATLKRKIDVGADPLGELKAARAADTVAQLCDRFIAEHLPKTRPSTQASYKQLISLHINRPPLAGIKVADVTYSDIDRLHSKIGKTAPYAANRTLAVLSKMFALAIRWEMRADNPAVGVERKPEHKRRRYLSGDELARLTVALAGHADQDAANIVRLLLLTGARRGEVLAAKWNDLKPLADGVWSKPGATTKQKTDHVVPLSAPARLLLAELEKTAKHGAEYVFPGRLGGHRLDVKDAWHSICKAAKIAGCRVHDLRHTYASVLASAGQSLPIIGALLGHTQPSTTARYAHLQSDPLRAATEIAGAIITGKPSAEVVPIKGVRR